MAQDEQPTSIWKKEISFRRKPKETFTAADDGEQEASVWKKEISLRKKSQEPLTDPATVEVESVDPEPTVDPMRPEPVALEPVAHEAASEPPPEPVIEHDWLTQPLEEVSEPPSELPAPTTITLVPPVEELEQPTLVPVPVPVPEPEFDLPPEPEFELPPVAEITPALVDLPAPATELVAQAVLEPASEETSDAPTKVPFYKRELSLKRTPQAPKAPKAPKAAKAPKPAKPDRDGKAPFYKRGLSLNRAPKQWDAAEPADAGTPKLRRLPRPKPSLPRFGGNAKTIVGLKIGASQIAAARVDNNGSRELVQAVREPLELGIVVNGELRDPEALAVALKDFFTRHNLPKRGVRLGIANNRIGVRTFEVTGIADPKQLANAIHFRAQEVLPIPIEEAVLDYQVLSESVNDEGQPVRRVLLVVAYRDLVDRYLLACRKAGIQVVGIDLEAFALLRAIAEPHDPVPGSERGAVVAVSVGHDRSTFAVSDGRVCEFTRVLEWGGWSLNVAIARALESSPSEVEQVKRALSLVGPEEVPEGLTADQLTIARDAAKRQLQTFARELVSSLQFYQNQPGSLGIGEIALTGGTSHLPGLGAELERLIGVPVRVVDPLARVKVSKKVRERDQVGSLAIAIGLGIED